VRIVTDYKHARQIIVEQDARIAKLEADATCWTHGMNKEGTTGGMYLKANCPDCTDRIAKLEERIEKLLASKFAASSPKLIAKIITLANSEVAK